MFMKFIITITNIKVYPVIIILPLVIRSLPLSQALLSHRTTFLAALGWGAPTSSPLSRRYTNYRDESINSTLIGNGTPLPPEQNSPVWIPFLNYYQDLERGRKGRTVFQQRQAPCHSRGQMMRLCQLPWHQR